MAVNQFTPPERQQEHNNSISKHCKTVVTVCFLYATLPFNFSAVYAQDLYWVCGDGFNWDSSPATFCWATTPGGVATVTAPATGDNIYLTQSGASDITIEFYDPAPEATTGVLRIDATGAGNMILSQSSYVHNLRTDTEIIGDTGSGQVLQSAGTHDVTFTLVMGDTATGDGGFTIQNSGSTLSASNLYVGNRGLGDMDILNGAAVSSGFGILGNNAGGSGDVTIDGTGSRWDAAGQFHVGNNGSGMLTIQNGGVLTNNTGTVGRYVGSSGTVLIDGAGSSWVNNATLSIGGTSTASGGSADVTVQNGGDLQVAGNLKVWGPGTLNIHGGSVTAGSFDAILGAFNFTDGTLTVDGGTYDDGNTDLIINSAITLANPTLVLTNGATASPAGDALIGNAGTGSLNIINGSSLDTTLGGTGSTIGVNGGSGGFVIIDGVGSSWNTDSLTVGEAGAATMSVQNGGSQAVGVDLVLGNSATGNGNYNLSGTGGLTVGGSVYIGYDGTGSFTQSGGTNSVTNNILLGYNTTGDGSYSLSGGGLTAVNETIGVYGSGSFTQSGGTHDVNSLTLGLFSSAAGTYNLNGGSLTVVGNIVSYSGTGILNIDGGTLLVGGGNGSIDVDTFRLGFASGTTGSHTLSGTASLTALAEFIGYQGTGIFVQNGGTNEIRNALYIGHDAGSNGSYDLSNGSLTIGDAPLYIYSNEIVGHYGTGVFTQSGGSNDIVSTLILGYQTTGDGSYDMSGGSIAADSEVIGGFGSGSFTQSGGVNNVTNNLTIGSSLGSNGNYDLSNGSLTTNNTYIGSGDIGSFTQSGGTHDVTTSLYLGNLATGDGTYNLGGGDLTVGGDIVNGPGTGTFNIDGGTLLVGGGNGSIDIDNLRLGNALGSSGSHTLSGTGSLTANSEIIGRFGSGVFTQNGGTNNVNALFLGSSVTGNGEYNLSGSGSLTANNVYVGDVGIGSFIHSSGTHDVTNVLYLGLATGSDGSYSLSGTGSLTAGTEYIGFSGDGYFTQSGGTHNVTGLSLGTNATGSGTYNLTGGALTVAGNIVNGVGSSTLSINGGTLLVGGGNGSIDVDTFNLGSFGNGGSHTLSGTGSLTADTENISFGSFIQNGGVHNVTTSLYVRGSYFNSGTYDLNGGTLTVGSEYIGGDEGGGRFTQSGGTHIVTNDLSLGYNSYSTGTYNLDGGTLTVGGSVTKGSGISRLNIDGGTLLVGGGNGSIDVDSFSLGFASGTTGSHILSGAGSLIAHSEIIGSNGNGNFTHNGGTNDVNGLYLGYYTNGDGDYLLSGTSSLTANSETIGFDGTGSFTQSGGTNVVASLYLGRNTTGSGNYNLSGGSLSAGALYLGGSATTAGGTGVFNLTTGGSAEVAGELKLWSGGTVNLNGGMLTTGGLNSSGSFNFNAGTLNVLSGLSTSNLGTTTTLNGLKTLTVSGVTTLDGFSSLSLDGGIFSTGSLVDNGGFSFNSGTFNLTSDDLLVGSGGLFGARVQLDFDQVVNVSNTVTVASEGVLSFNGGMITGAAIINNGTVDLNDPISTLGGGVLINNSHVTGDGRISASLINNVGGQVAVNFGDNLTFTNSGNANNGQINLLGGTVRVDQDLINNTGGIISGMGNLIAAGGLTNEGTIALSGGTTGVGGDVNNTTGGTIIVSGNSTATFFDDVVHNGDEFRVSDGSSAVFFGSVSGTSSYTGTGSLFFEGDLNPGNSPGLVNVEGDLYLGTNSHTLMELGGLLLGDEYDAFNIAGDLSLAGELEIEFFDSGGGLFEASLGDTFDIFSAESISGSFDLLTLAVLGDGLGWELDFLTDEIGTIDIARLTVVSASTVPVPSAVWLFCSGLIGLVGIARKKKS